MTLVDTSVWVGHLRSSDGTLAALLDAGRVLSHPYVIDELALGHLKPRAVILDLLAKLPKAQVASNDELLQFIDRNALAGLGIGYVDAHLLAATRLTPPTKLWTHDKRLHMIAFRLNMAWARPSLAG